MNDPQVTTGLVLRPFRNFETVYQGQPISHPIAMPGTLDASAGTPGYAPALLAGVPVPMGATALFFFPVVYSSDDFGTPVSYTYQIVWRPRNIVDYINTRESGFHIPRSSGGAVDSRTPLRAQRLIVPAAYETVVVAGGSDTSSLVRHQVEVPGEAPFNPITDLPLLEGGARGEFEQGIADPVAVPQAVGPLFRTYQTMAKGDDLIVLARRTDDSPGTWDFSGADAAFSNSYGTNVGGDPHPTFEAFGVWVFCGSGARL